MEPTEIIKDPNFIQLPDEERRKVMLQIDPDRFGGLPLEEQNKVLGIKAVEEIPSIQDQTQPSPIPSDMPLTDITPYTPLPVETTPPMPMVPGNPLFEQQKEAEANALAGKVNIEPGLGHPITDPGQTAAMLGAIGATGGLAAIPLGAAGLAGADVAMGVTEEATKELPPYIKVPAGIAAGMAGGVAGSRLAQKLGKATVEAPTVLRQTIIGGKM